jgi:hypothetical protein
MLFLIWNRWLENHQRRWLVLIGCMLVADAIVGSRIIAWELQWIRF